MEETVETTCSCGKTVQLYENGARHALPSCDEWSSIESPRDLVAYVRKIRLRLEAGVT